MTDEECDKIFGSGLIMIGIKRPMRSDTHQTGEKHHGHFSAQTGTTPRGNDIRGQGIIDPVQDN
ncbi:MAG: hypothetical protein FJ184_12230 [Gammaproteobacteria bacterium]|nr:hypothetical protein [Gammaproteobacteria bacterium]